MNPIAFAALLPKGPTDVSEKAQWSKFDALESAAKLLKKYNPWKSYVQGGSISYVPDKAD
jgi:hypothetical protein